MNLAPFELYVPHLLHRVYGGHFHSVSSSGKVPNASITVYQRNGMPNTVSPFSYYTLHPDPAQNPKARVRVIIIEERLDVMML